MLIGVDSYTIPTLFRDLRPWGDLLPVDIYAEDMVRAVLECLDDGLVLSDAGHWEILSFFFFYIYTKSGL